MSVIAARRSLRVSSRRRDFERRCTTRCGSTSSSTQPTLRRRGPARRRSRRARAEFGSVDARREECRDAAGCGWSTSCAATSATPSGCCDDAGVHAARPLSLGLGIGANTAIFSLIDTVLVKTLPVDDPQRLFFVDTPARRAAGSGPPYPCFERLRRHNRLFGVSRRSRGRRFKVSIDGGRSGRGSIRRGTYYACSACPIPAGCGCSTEPDRPRRPRRGRRHQRRLLDAPLRQGSRRAREGRSGRGAWVTIVGVTPPGFFGSRSGRRSTSRCR